MWNVYRGDPLEIQVQCLDVNENDVDLTGYSVGLNFVWGDDDDERLEVSDDIDLTAASAGVATLTLTDEQIDTFPTGKKTSVFLILTPPSENQFTTFLGKITVRDA